MFARHIGAACSAAIVCALSLTGPAAACGDKLVALGGGVGFERIMVSRNPGHIVLLAEPDTGLAAANERFNLAASLTLAGHEVFVAKSAEEFRARRDELKPDLVLVDASRAAQLELPAASAGAKPAVMPVAYYADGSRVAATFQPSSCVTVAEGRKGAEILKAVEHTLKLRSRGQATSCESGPDKHQKT